MKPSAEKNNDSPETFTAGPVEVFSLNFARREVLSLAERRMMRMIVLVYFVFQGVLLGAFIVWLCFLGFRHHSMRQYEVKRLGAKVDSKQFQDDMTALRQTAQKTLAELNTAIQLEKDRFQGGARLAALVRSLPSRAWITSISGRRQDRVFTVRSKFLVDPKQPYKLPGDDWLEQLKKDPVFSKDLKRIEIKSSKQYQVGVSEVYEFEILAGW